MVVLARLRVFIWKLVVGSRAERFRDMLLLGRSVKKLYHTFYDSDDPRSQVFCGGKSVLTQHHADRGAKELGAGR